MKNECQTYEKFSKLVKGFGEIIISILFLNTNSTKHFIIDNCI